MTDAIRPPLPDAHGADRRPIQIQCRNVWKVYGDRAEIEFQEYRSKLNGGDDLTSKLREAGVIIAASDVSFDVEKGEIFVIMGLSGSGKSTIVRCLSRLVEPTSGQVVIDGEDLLAMSEDQLIQLRRHKMGMVFQSFGLLPHLNVLDNVGYPLRVQGMSRADRDRRAMQMIELVGLAGREKSFPRELSGGMQQRVGIARSLAVEPDIWFLDEPFSALDPLIRRQMQDEFLRLQGVLKKTIVFITHDFLEALRLADRIAIMREGTIVQTGTPAEIVLQPIDDYVAEFTRDVPLVKVVTAGAICRPLTDGADCANAVAASAIVEGILPDLAGRGSALAVRDAGGRIVGEISAGDVLELLTARVRK